MLVYVPYSQNASPKWCTVWSSPPKSVYRRLFPVEQRGDVYCYVCVRGLKSCVIFVIRSHVKAYMAFGQELWMCVFCQTLYLLDHMWCILRYEVFGCVDGTQDICDFGLREGHREGNQCLCVCVWQCGGWVCGCFLTGSSRAVLCSKRMLELRLLCNWEKRHMNINTHTWIQTHAQAYRLGMGIINRRSIIDH